MEYFADLAAVVRDADPTDKAQIYPGLNLVLTYQPAAQTVRAHKRAWQGIPMGLWFVSEGRVASYVHADDHWLADPRGSGDQARGLLN